MSPTSRVAFWAVTLLFLASRLYVLFLAEIQGSTIVMVNLPYALSFRAAAREGTSFYAEIENLKHRMDQRQELTGMPAQEVEYRVEYPPLAIEWMRVPLRLQPTARPGDDLSSVENRVVLITRAIMACVDVVGFAILAMLLVRLFPQESAAAYALRLLLYVAGGFILFHLLYDRLDLPVGVLVLAAFWQFADRPRWLLSFFILAVVINYKLTPAVLAPVWIAGSLPAAAFAGPMTRDRTRRLAASALGRALVLAGFTVVIFLPFYFAWGDATLDFLEYHAKRGLQVESLWSAVLLVIARIRSGEPLSLLNFGAYHLKAPGAQALAAISPWVTLVLLALATVSFWKAVRRRMAGIEPGSRTLAQAAPDLIAGYTVLFLLVSIASAKVLSPQYFLWLVPLAPLLPWKGALNRAFLIGYVAMLVLTTVIYPYLYAEHIIPEFTSGELVRTAPTALGLGFLVARNLLMVAVTVVLWLRLRRESQA